MSSSTYTETPNEDINNPPEGKLTLFAGDDGVLYIRKSDGSDTPIDASTDGVGTATVIVENANNLPDTLSENTRYILQNNIVANNPVTGSEGAILDLGTGSLTINSASPLLSIDGVSMTIIGDQGITNTGSGSGITLSNAATLTTLNTSVSSTSGPGVFLDATTTASIYTTNSNYNGGTNGLEIGVGGKLDNLVQVSSNFTGTSKGFLADGDIGLWNASIGTCTGTASNGIDINGNVTDGWQPVNLQVISFGSDAADITGSTFDGISTSGGAFISLASGFSALRGDAASANINNEANFSQTSFITIVPGDPKLAGIDFLDIKYDFNKCPNIEDSYYLAYSNVTTQGTTTNPGLGVWADVVATFTSVPQEARWETDSAGISTFNGNEDIPVNLTATFEMERDSGTGPVRIELRWMKSLDGGSSYNEVDVNQRGGSDIDNRARQISVSLEDTATIDDGVDQAAKYKVQVRNVDSGTVDTVTDSGKIDIRRTV